MHHALRERTEFFARRPGGPETFDLRTDRQLIEMDLSGIVTRTVSLDGIPLKSHVTYLETSGDEGQTVQRFLWWDTSTRIDSGNSVETHYATINEAGEHSAPQTVRWQDHNSGLSLAEVRTAIGCGLPSLLMIAGAELFRPSIQQGRYRTSPVAATACALLTLLSIWLMWRHSGQHVVAFRKTWLVFVLLLGPFGYLGYRCHCQWTGVRRNASALEPPVALPTIIAA